MALWLNLKLNRDILLISVASLLKHNLSRCSSQVRDVFVSAIVHIVHSILMAKNSLQFSLDAFSLQTISKANCLYDDVTLLEFFLIPPSYRRVKDIIPVVWKPPTISWIKVNTNGSFIDITASCGGLFCDFRGTFMVCFASNLGRVSVFEAELTGLILAMEFAALNNWNRLWLDSDSSSAVQAFTNPTIIPFHLQNQWHNCFQLGLTVICSHIFRVENFCADKLTTLG